MTIQDPEDLRDYVESFDDDVRAEYARLERRMQISPLQWVTAGARCIATIRAGKAYRVSLSYDSDEGWGGECNCVVRGGCVHDYALALRILDVVPDKETTEAPASNPPAPVPMKGTAPMTTASSPSSASVPTAPSPKPLAQLLSETLGRRLRSDEMHFMRKFEQLAQRLGSTRRITVWDFHEIGLPLPGAGWDQLKIWPTFPQNQHELWLYMANALVERGRAIPPFLLPISDLAHTRERMERWRRSQEIERWKKVFSRADCPRPVESAPPPREADLWLCLGEAHATLAWKRPGSEVIEPLKDAHHRRLVEEYRAGHLTLTPTAEMLWYPLEAHARYYGHPAQMNYGDDTMLELLHGLLRIRALEDHIVNDAGQPLRRVPEPLRWDVQTPAEKRGDYTLRLVQQDGRPVPSLLFHTDGTPPFYVTRDAVFTGPAVDDATLDPTQPVAIPAPALETQGGVEFLNQIAAPLPPALAERVQRVRVRLAVSCALRPPYPNSPQENCVVKFSAEAEDGSLEESWNGTAWQKSRLSLTPPGLRRKDVFVVFDRRDLADAPGLISSLGAKWDPVNHGFSVRVTKKFPGAFVPWVQSMPEHVKLRLEGDLASLFKDAIAGSVRLDVTETEVDWFDLKVVLDVSDTTLTPEELKLLLNAKGGYVRLEGRGWQRLKFNLTGEDDERLARLGLTPHELSAEPQRMHALQLADEAAKKFLPEAQVERIERRASEIKARVTPALPDGVRAQLRPYQMEGFHFLAYLAANRFGGILADDMGLGKTLQTLAWLAWLRGGFSKHLPAGEAAVLPPCLVVCPKSVMDNWRAEAERFTPGLRVKIWRASEVTNLTQAMGEADVHVLNYSQLRLAGEELANVRWQVVILDEGQYIKNPSSQTAQVARALRSEHRLVLSGTPIENRLLDLWSLMSFAMPGALGSRAQFGKIYDAKEDPFARRRLSARVRPFLLRRTKSQVAKDLPDRVEEDLYCEIEGEQRTLYRAELKRAQQLLLNVKTQQQLAKQRFHFLTSLLRLRQICCDPRLVKADSKAPGAKLEALLEQLEPLIEEGHKVLVFSQFVEMLHLLRGALEEKGWPIFYLAGETENRGELVEKFQNAEGAAVFLISLKAGGFGLNLTAASYVVLFDPWWNPAVENQAIDRTHRIGQANKVIAYRLLIKESIEEKIRALQKQKSAIAEDVLGEEKFAQSLTIDDLKFLFAD